VDRFVAPSAFLRDRVVEGGLPPDRVTVLPNPVAVADAPREPPAGPPRVVYAGRLVAEKGVRTLLNAVSAFPPGVRLAVVGSGRLEREVRDRVRAERLPVDLLGPTDPAGVGAHLRASTAAVLPALWWENCPMAVLEAAAQGVPVVASAVGGIPELVDDGVTGRLVAPGDADTLATAVTDLVADPEAARRMGRLAWERVRERHDPAVHVDALERCYEEVRAAAAR
jgi:glycosyltransferase involved in cell wall biosynthesis